MIRVLIATNEPVLAAGLEGILKAGGLETTDICEDVVQLFDSIERFRPDVAILDSSVSPAMSVIGELRIAAPNCQLVLWSRNLSQEDANEAISLGVRGVMPANVSPAQLIETVHLLATFPLPQPSPGNVMRRLCNPTERQVIALVGCGMKNTEIAALMRTDEGTVNRLIKSVSRRLGVQDRYELALYGLSAGNEPQPIEMETQTWKKEIATA